jgi:enamine deaminase RidA (YjgF/YER057c/UK114 family)
LAEPPNPAANYIPARRCGSLLFVAGQVPKADGMDQFVGKLGRDISVEDGQKTARLCAINILAQVSAALALIRRSIYSSSQWPPRDC